MGVVAVAPVVAAAACGVSCMLLVPRLAIRAHDFSTRVAVRARMRRNSVKDWPSEDDRRVGPGTFIRAALDICFESGIPSLRKPTIRLLGCPPIAGEVERIVTVLRFKGVRATTEGACQTLLALGIAAFMASLLIAGSLITAVLAVVTCMILIHMRISREQAASVARSQELVPDAMRALGVYYGSGLTLVQSFEHAAVEVPQPLGPRLGEVAVSMKAGMPASDALARLRGDGDSARSFTFVSIALEIQHATGAPMQPLLERVAESVSASLKLKRSLEVQTAQARLSAKIVSIMPLLVVGLMALVNPSYLVGFLSSPVGLGMFVTACVLELMGILSIRKILDVEVG